MFYPSLLLPLGYALKKDNNGDLSYWLQQGSSTTRPFPDAYFKVPSIGQPVPSGNGRMVVFERQSLSQIRRLYSAVLYHGRTLEFDPSFNSS